MAQTKNHARSKTAHLSLTRRAWVSFLKIFWPPGACAAGNRWLSPCFVSVSYYFFFNDFCQAYYLDVNWTDCQAVFIGSAVAVDERSEPRFSNFQGTLP